MNHTQTYSSQDIQKVFTNLIQTNARVNFPDILSTSERNYQAIKTIAYFLGDKESLLWNLQKDMEQTAVGICNIDLDLVGSQEVQNMIKAFSATISQYAGQLSQILEPSEYKLPKS